MFVRYVNKQGHPWTKFVDIVPLEAADGVCNTITTSLETIDIDEETLKLVGCIFDGANVMMGKSIAPVSRRSRV